MSRSLIYGENSPEILQVLNPLKEANGDTSGIGVYIRENSDASISQNLISLQKPVSGAAQDEQEHVTLHTVLLLVVFQP